MTKRKLIIQLFNRMLPDLPRGKAYPCFEFHVLESVRDVYGLDDSLFSTSGNVIFPDYRSVRNLAQTMNSRRDIKNHPEQAIHAGQLNAMGLIDEIYHYVLRLYEETHNPQVFMRAEAEIKHTAGKKKAGELLHQFTKSYPPRDVYTGKDSVEGYLDGITGSKPNSEITIEEIILLYFANFNPAFSPFKELFDDKHLVERTVYSHCITDLERFFQSEKRFGPHNQYMFDLLRAPILASPNSLSGQLDFIKRHWGLILSEKYLLKIIGAGDLFKEDTKQIFHGRAQSPPVPNYRLEDMKGVGLLDIERFTSDLDWMPNVVLLAKNIYVWLDQLSKKYSRPIAKLNEIPDEELDRLARWNLTALWLIGVWERSPVSQKIKQWTGNPEAVSSAYSLYDYTIASDLGGEESFQNLRHRAWQRGIRLAGDMVPNHMGIFSKWVAEHPDYFIQSGYPPFPNYNFTGENLADHHDIEVRIEDGYWNRSDASVVFQRIDKKNGDIRYIYHGNDGTHMPWNDTAQLDFLRSEVREAVIQTIFHVARKFSIIRFDAAMTLTKRHFQRLWYPQTGSGGDIPSRADHSLTTEDFNRLFPNEFWREVVDRINHEMPDTLLLAEAFWLLEGYFVRTLGMHRVYNSAFMHMLMKEENSKYRELIRNTLHYNPEILKRYVNFMSNPDEQTAIEQFGKNDKYFGIALMMVTLPGLPMFAHGQIEGFGEKYGMEYKKAYYSEEPDQDLIRRHEHEIFPLLAKRFLFSQVSNFEMYDFKDDSGNLNENVFAYSNISGSERVLICYHNKYEETSGWIKMTSGRNTGQTDKPSIEYRSLGEALSFAHAEDILYIYSDLRTNLQYIRSGKDLNELGLHVELKAFQYNVFIGFTEVHDESGDFSRLAYHLHRQGVKDIHDELLLVKAFPVHLKLFDLINQQKLTLFRELISGQPQVPEKPGEPLNSLIKKYKLFLEQVRNNLRSGWTVADMLEATEKQINLIRLSASGTEDADRTGTGRNSMLLMSWLFVKEITRKEEINKLKLEKAFNDIFTSCDFSEESSKEMVSLLFILLNSHRWPLEDHSQMSLFFSSTDVHNYILLNEHDGTLYFNKERFEDLIKWLAFTLKIDSLASGEGWSAKTGPRTLSKLDDLVILAEKVGYRFKDFQENIVTETEK